MKGDGGFELDDRTSASRASVGEGAGVFLALWTLAIVAVAVAFILFLALRGKVMSLGYELGRLRAEQSQFQEMKRVLVLESASYKSPERVETVARTLLGMGPPTPAQMIMAGPMPADSDAIAAGSKRKSTGATP